MAEIRIKESTFVEHATDLSEAGKGSAYEPLSSGNMSYSRSNSINDLRTAIMESIEVMNQVTQLSEKDAERLRKMGHAFAEQDHAAGQKINELEVR